MTKPTVADLGFANVRRGCHIVRTYVGVAAQEADSEPFAIKMARLTTTLRTQVAESAKLEAVIRANLTEVGLDAMDGGGA